MIDFLLDALFPKRCLGCRKFGDYICTDCFSFITFPSFSICPVCNKSSIDGATHPSCKAVYSIDGLLSAVVYKGVIKRLVHQFKYKPYLSDLKNSIGKLFSESLIQNETFFSLLKQKPVLVPVPLFSSRQIQRDYNHAAILADFLAKEFDLMLLPGTLIRTRSTSPQFKLNKQQREQNVKGAFRLNQENKRDIAGRLVLLVDDLATTCFTIRACAKALKQNKAKSVWGIVFARES